MDYNSISRKRRYCEHQCRLWEHGRGPRNGFAFCKKCGHMTPGKRLPPRDICGLMRSPERTVCTQGILNEDLKSDFEAAINGKCEHSADETMIHGKSRLLLARKFTTNIMSLKIRWDDQHWVNLKEEQETGERLPKPSAKVCSKPFAMLIQNLPSHQTTLGVIFAKWSNPTKVLKFSFTSGLMGSRVAQRSVQSNR